MVSGIGSAMFAAISVDLRSRDYLQGRAQTIADSIPAETINFLEGTADDVDKFEYRQVKDVLERINANNSDLSFVYIMQNRPENPIFLVDSISPDDEDFSPPGEVYDEGSEQLKKGFSTNKPFVDGPSRDRWGVWLSGFAPISDPASGNTVAWVGIDTPGINYYSEIAIYAIVPLCLAAIPLAGLLRDRKLAHKEWEISQLKQQFVSIASHELRSPLSGMVWAIQSLLKSGDKNMTDQQKSLLKDMFQSAQASTATINEILDLSVFERQQTQQLRREVVDLVTIVHEVEKTLRLGAQERRLTITDEDMPKTALTYGDLGAIKRAIMNIVSNSVKYGFEGSTIRIHYRLDDNEHIISIQDHGIGIPRAEQEKVLGGYHRAANATKVQASGTGLGLWMSRLIVEEHGGRLWLSSEENTGTTISLALPVSDSAKSTKPV